MIEADERSGALITARQACDDHGRPVFALPGRIDNRMSAGPHKLIRDGATLVRDLGDIVDGLGPLPHSAMELTPSAMDESALAKPQAENMEVPIQLSDQQRVIYAQLGEDPLDVDAIIERTSLPAHQILQELTFLSLKGVVRRVDGQTFVRKC